MKLKNLGPWGARVPRAPLDPPLNMHIVNEQKYKIPKGGKMLSTKFQMAAHMMQLTAISKQIWLLPRCQHSLVRNLVKI